MVGHLAELQEQGRALSSASTASATSAAALREGEIDLDRLQCHADNLAAWVARETPTPAVRPVIVAILLLIARKHPLEEY